MDKTRRWRFTAIALVTALMFVAVAGYALAFSSSEEDEILWHIRNTAHNFWKFWTEDSPGNFPHEVAAIKEVLDTIDAELADKPKIFERWTNYPTTFAPGTTPVAEHDDIRLTCDQAFQLNAIYVSFRDPDESFKGGQDTEDVLYGFGGSPYTSAIRLVEAMSGTTYTFLGFGLSYAAERPDHDVEILNGPVEGSMGQGIMSSHPISGGAGDEILIHVGITSIHGGAFSGDETLDVKAIFYSAQTATCSVSIRGPAV